MSKTTTSAQHPWVTWTDFDDEGEPTGYTIIGDLSADRAVFCTVEATPGEIALGVRLPEMRELLAEATRLMPGGAVVRETWKARVAALLTTVAEQ
jgi:hypothetical protein